MGGAGEPQRGKAIGKNEITHKNELDLGRNLVFEFVKIRNCKNSGRP